MPDRDPAGRGDPREGASQRPAPERGKAPLLLFLKDSSKLPRPNLTVRQMDRMAAREMEERYRNWGRKP